MSEKEDEERIRGRFSLNCQSEGNWAASDDCRAEGRGVGGGGEKNERDRQTHRGAACPADHRPLHQELLVIIRGASGKKEQEVEESEETEERRRRKVGT